MGVLRKFNEFFYPEDSESKEIKTDSTSNEITKDEMDQLEKLSKGQVGEVKIGDFTVSMPSEFDGQAFLVVNKEGKHQKISFTGGYTGMAEAERKVLDILGGKVMLESKRNRRQR
jgi:hypothetical protein